jgi:hypothetical protein
VSNLSKLLYPNRNQVPANSPVNFCLQDSNTGNWWLQVGGTNVGYWPSSLFTQLQSSASNVQWGGEVFSSSAGQSSTQMGSGHFPGEGFGKASYIRNIQVVDSSNSLSQAGALGFIRPSPGCYDLQSTGSSGNDWGTYIFYGGPGRNANCQ